MQRTQDSMEEDSRERKGKSWGVVCNTAADKVGCLKGVSK